MTDITDDHRADAERAAADKYPVSGRNPAAERDAFVRGAAWEASRHRPLHAENAATRWHAAEKVRQDEATRLAEHDAKVRAEQRAHDIERATQPYRFGDFGLGWEGAVASIRESAGAQPSSDSRYSTSRTGGISQPQDGQTQMPAGDDMTVKHSRHRGPNSQSSSTDGSYDTQTQNGDPK